MLPCSPTPVRLGLAALLVLCLAACTDDAAPDPPTDAEPTDDAGPADVGRPDAIPDATHPDDATPDAACVPDCTDRACGPDGCGAQCGSCPADGECVAGQCAPACGDGVCAAGESCAGCPADCGCGPGEDCAEGMCICAPDCDGRTCGPDGCGGECGACAGDCLENVGRCVVCGDGTCDPGEDRQGCPEDCGAGCIDDAEEPNQDALSATVVELVADGLDGWTGQAADRVICGDDVDVYAVTLAPGQRMRVDLDHDRDGANLDLILDGEALDAPIEARGFETPERIEYPPLGEHLRSEATFLVTVLPAAGDPWRQAPYDLTITAVDGLGGCFPDRAEPDDRRQDGTPVPAIGGRFDRTLCPEDVDAFTLRLGADDGLDVEVRPVPADTAIELRLFPADAGPADAPFVDLGDDGRIAVPANTGAFAAGPDWVLRVTGAEADVIADYTIAFDRLRGAGCDDDGGTEPDNDVGVELPEALPVGQPVDVPWPTAICRDDRADVDVFCFAAEPGETVEAWATTPPAGADGPLVVQLLDADGRLVGRSGRASEVGEPLDPARAVAVGGGRMCLRVSGAGGAQGPYAATVNRTAPPAALCGDDVAEAAGRNDLSQVATPLMGADIGNARRWTFEGGFLCDVVGPDADWYAFAVDGEGARLCAMVDRLDRPTDARLELFPAAGDPQGMPCGAGCDGACIAGRCTPPRAQSDRRHGFEMIDLRRPFTGDLEGQHLLRVDHEDGIPSPYRLTVSVTPTPSALNGACAPDGHEGLGDNDEMNRATYLAAGAVGLCDTWICAAERNAGDWYTIDVPPGQDRTVIINYSNPVEGRLSLLAIAPDLPAEPESGVGFGFLAAGNHQCINIRGGAEENPVYVHVAADQIADVERVDYTLQVVPTDLDADPEGACEGLGAADFPACPPRGEWDDLGGLGPLQPEDCWVTIDTP